MKNRFLARPPRREYFAFDRASVRRTDVDGHLFVERSVCTMEGVSPYHATEIPDWEYLRLTPGRIYQVYRPGAELAKAVMSLDGKPLLSKHQPISSNAHPHKLTVGSVSNPQYQGGMITAQLSIWDEAAIEQIDAGSSRDLSCGYRYEAVPRRGIFRGQAYDLEMRRIQFNHVTLCSEARVPGAVVADSAAELLKHNKTRTITMPTTAALLEIELRKRFANPYAVMAKLGLDASLLHDDEPDEEDDQDDDDQDQDDDDGDDTRSEIVGLIQQLAEAFENRDDDAIRACFAQIKSLTGGGDEEDSVATDEDDNYGANREDPADLAAMERRALAEGKRRRDPREMAKDAASASSYNEMFGLRKSRPATLFIPTNRPAVVRTRPDTGRSLAMDNRRQPAMSSAELADYDDFFGKKREVR